MQALRIEKESFAPALALLYEINREWQWLGLFPRPVVVANPNGWSSDIFGQRRLARRLVLRLPFSQTIRGRGVRGHGSGGDS